MAWMEGTHEETRTLPVSAEVAAAYFADPEAIVAATKGVERTEVDGATIHFVLEEEDHGVVKFKADYRCTYTRDGHTVTWSSGDDGNLKQSGRAEFTDTDGGCTMAYAEKLEIDLPVPGMMKSMLQPMLGPLVGKEIAAYLDRMVAGLPS